MAKKSSVLAFYVFSKVDEFRFNPTILLRRRDQDKTFEVTSSYFKGNNLKQEKFNSVEEAIAYIQNEFLSNPMYKLERVQ